MTPARTYTIGLPVIVTVHDDGTVTFEVDTSEAACAPDEYDPETHLMYDENGTPFIPSDEVQRADAERIEAAVAGGAR